MSSHNRWFERISRFKRSPKNFIERFCDSKLPGLHIFSTKKYKNSKSGDGLENKNSTQFNDDWIKEQIYRKQTEIDHCLENNQIDKSVLLFFELRKYLSELSVGEKLYNQEQTLRANEAKAFQRNIKESVNLNDEFDVYMVSDSLGLPRPHETKEEDFGIAYTTANIFNHCQDHHYMMNVWAQRYFTTSKLLEHWGSLLDNNLLNGKHFVVHLGLNDCSERMFLERERLSMDSIDANAKDKIIEFVRRYRNEIIQNQTNYSYVPLAQFSKNISTICEKAKAEKARSIKFVNIIAYTTRAKSYNDVITSLAKQDPFVNIIDFDMAVKKHGRDVCLLPDNMHPSHNGNKILAELIASNIET